MKSENESEIFALYRALLEAWNTRNADDYAGLFAENGSLVGFDGSSMNGRSEIETHLRQIFMDHQTARYIWIIREVRFLSPETALLRAVVGMIPPEQSDINPVVNAIQSMVAVNQDGGWRIALIQSTPAQFHGRPAEAQALTEELRRRL